MARGRNPSNVELLNKVKDVLQVETVSEFAERCGQTTGNMSNYLSGQRTPGARVLRSCLKRLMAPERPQGVEFLRTLRRFSDAGTVSAFALACGKSAANMNAYLSGKSVPGTKVLRDCVHHLFSWQIEPLAEVAPLDEVDLPKAAGVYVLYDSSGSVLYV